MFKPRTGGKRRPSGRFSSSVRQRTRVAGRVDPRKNFNMAERAFKKPPAMMTKRPKARTSPSQFESLSQTPVSHFESLELHQPETSENAPRNPRAAKPNRKARK